jgi:hypothetical protein
METADTSPTGLPTMMRITSQRLLLLALGCLLTGCHDEPVGKAVVSSKELLLIFGSQEVIDVVRASTDVHAYRLAEPGYYEADLVSYDRAGEPVRVAEVDRVMLRDLLLDEGSYELELAKGCEPVFGVGVSFVAREQAVDILFCFECDILAVYQDGKVVGDEDFDPARTRLVRLVKKFFPDDNVIQQLK